MLRPKGLRSATFARARSMMFRRRIFSAQEPDFVSGETLLDGAFAVQGRTACRFCRLRSPFGPNVRACLSYSFRQDCARPALKGPRRDKKRRFMGFAWWKPLVHSKITTTHMSKNAQLGLSKQDIARDAILQTTMIRLRWGCNFPYIYRSCS